MKIDKYKIEISFSAITVVILFGMYFFNDAIKYIRLKELKISLQRSSKDDNNFNHIGLVMKYKEHRKSYNGKNNQDKSDIIEMRVNSILSHRETKKRINSDNNKLLTIPVLNIINFIRWVSDREKIIDIMDNKSIAYIDVAYYYERNNFYDKALDIYKEARKKGVYEASTLAGIILHEGFCYSLAGGKKNRIKAKESYISVVNNFSTENAAITAIILLQHLEGFMSEINKIIKNEKDSVNKGVKLYNNIAYKEALNVFLRIEKTIHKSETSRLEYFKGRCYEELSQKAKAIEIYQRIIEVNSKSKYAKMANRRIYLAGFTANNGRLIKILSIRNNLRLNDNTLKDMIKIDRRINKFRHERNPRNVLKNSLFIKTMKRIEKISPIFAPAELEKYSKMTKSHDRITDKKKTIIENKNNTIETVKTIKTIQTVKTVKPAKTKNTIKYRIYINDGNQFIGAITHETASFINFSTSLGNIKINKSKIIKMEMM